MPVGNKEGEEIRWVNGVPYSEIKPPYGEPQAWDWYLNIHKPNQEKYMEEVRKKWNDKIKIIDCPDCDGQGIVDEEIKESFASDRVTPRYKKVNCRLCNGSGIIENIEG